jgi:hypothetical protein
MMKSIYRVLSRYTIAWVLLYFTAMTVVMTWPLVTRLQNEMVGQVGDNIYFVWMIGWFKKALFDLHVNPFNVWFLNYPQGWSLAYTEITPAMLFLALPFSLVGGPTLGYNMALLLTFVLSGLGMYLWVKRLTGRVDAALIAGTIFGFIPYRFAHFLIGHLNLSGTMWFPFYFWGLYDLLETRRWSWKPVLLSAVSLGFIALSSQYYVYMALILSVVFVLGYLFFIDRYLWKDLQFWRRTGTMALVSLPFIALAVAPYAMLAGQGGLPDRNLGIVRMYSASPTDFILPSTDQFLWGAWIGTHFNREMWVEGTLYIGIVAIALGLLAWIKRKQSGHTNLLRLMMWGGIAAFILALGIDLHWNGEPLEITLPAFLAERLHRTELPLLLPGYVLFRYFPFFAKLRSLMRFGVFVLVFSSCAAGIGAAWLLGKTRARWQPYLALGLLVLVFIDFYPGPYAEFTRVEPRPVDSWLASQPGQGAVIQFPFAMEEDQEQTYYTLVHNKPYVGGFFNAFPPAQYSRIRPLMANFPDKQSISLLPELNVEYILVASDRYPDPAAVRQSSEALGLHYVTTVGGQMVFER